MKTLKQVAVKVVAWFFDENTARQDFTNEDNTEIIK
jgi:hypothetical protein